MLHQSMEKSLHLIDIFVIVIYATHGIQNTEYFISLSSRLIDIIIFDSYIYLKPKTLMLNNVV